MVARLAEVVARGWTAGAAALVSASLDLRFNPPLALKLEELLTDGFAGEPELLGELGDRGGAVLLESDQNGATTFGDLVYAENRNLPRFRN